MYDNLPVVVKLKNYVQLGDLVKVENVLRAYDILIHPRHFWLYAVAPATYQIEFYEIQLARYISRTSESLYFVERFSEGNVRGRKLGFIGSDGEECVRRYHASRVNLEEWYKRRYYTRKIKRGAPAAEAYRSGFMEAVLDRARFPSRDAKFYQTIFNLVKMRDILVPSRRELHDTWSHDVGLNDGLVCEFPVLGMRQRGSVMSSSA